MIGFCCQLHQIFVPPNGPELWSANGAPFIQGNICCHLHCPIHPLPRAGWWHLPISPMPTSFSRAPVLPPSHLSRSWRLPCASFFPAACLSAPATVANRTFVTSLPVCRWDNDFDGCVQRHKHAHVGDWVVIRYQFQTQKRQTDELEPSKDHQISNITQNHRWFCLKSSDVSPRTITQAFLFM